MTFNLGGCVRAGGSSGVLFLRGCMNGLTVVRLVHGH